MAIDKLAVIDSAVADFYTWINDILYELNWDDRHYALQALRGVLHTLRDRLSIDQGANLSAQLPLLVRGIFFENWEPSRTPVLDRHIEPFVDRIRREFSGYATPLDPVAVTRGVLSVLSRHISTGEVEKIRNSLPEELRLLWPLMSASPYR